MDVAHETGEPTPADWESRTIGELITFEGGSQPDKSFFRYSPRRGFVRLIQIRDYKSDEFETYVPRGLARKFCSASDIMIGRYGPPVFQILRGLEGAYNVALIKATPCSDLDRDYAYYFLSQTSLFKFVEQLSRRTSGQTGVDLEELRGYPFPLPSSTEQEAIAEALSDTDAFIELLEQLIAKKRLIKQGAMQELLTGKRRLPSFDGKWETRSFGQLASIRNSRALAQSVEPETLCVELEAVEPRTGRLLTRGRASESASSKYRFQRGDVLFGRLRSYLRKFWLADTDGLCTTEIWPLTATEHVAVPEFVYHVVQTDGFIDAAGISYGTHMPRADWKVVASFGVATPTPDEQRAIARVLSDMDAELAALGQKLKKARMIKQGMMHDLLTGKIRLV